MNENQDTLYARWLNQELSPEEQEALEKSGEAAVFRQIVATIDTWSLPELEPNSFEQVKNKLDNKEAKVVPLFKRGSFLAIAASIILLVGLFVVFNPFASSGSGITEVACNAGETKQFTLPDQTSIILYGKSKITYNKEEFSSDRKLNLEGEAFFEVNQKGPFEVDFNNGKVNVLGTKFNVLASKEESAVRCFEGKVKVDLSGNSTILVKGKAVRKTENGKFSEYDFTASTLPTIGGYRMLENISLEEVCNTISVFYDVRIVNQNVDLQRTFSGSMNQVNLDTALTTIFTPMNIDFTRDNKTVTIKNK